MISNSPNRIEAAILKLVDPEELDPGLEDVRLKNRDRVLLPPSKKSLTAEIDSKSWGG